MISIKVGPCDTAGATAEIATRVDETKEKVYREMLSRSSRALNAIRNVELSVLSGGPSAPGQPPGVRSGTLRGKNWRQIAQGGGGNVTLIYETGTFYAGYLEHGTSKMAARPFKDKITQESLPEVKSIYSEPYV